MARGFRAFLRFAFGGRFDLDRHVVDPEPVVEHFAAQAGKVY